MRLLAFTILVVVLMSLGCASGSPLPGLWGGAMSKDILSEIGSGDAEHAGLSDIFEKIAEDTFQTFFNGGPKSLTCNCLSSIQCCTGTEVRGYCHWRQRALSRGLRL